MSEQKWTQESEWRMWDEAHITHSFGGANALSKPDYNRATACVRACAGMPDPAAEIARLQEIDRTMSVKVKVKKDLTKQLEDVVKQRDNLRERLFKALDIEPILAEGLQEVDHSTHIRPSVLHNALDAASVYHHETMTLRERVRVLTEALPKLHRYELDNEGSLDFYVKHSDMLAALSTQPEPQS